ncbi:hypothetical protein QJS10_CPB19g00628 [Acorus calamus]|uniref:Uncharacterized protein n=1 Tax=Acorus calamus TaxID=4465 RepID=A0AAV9CHB1_ACOCL|nr:hypothetical protein QJS10_CPB19g00628 [Acorus calamus]
MLNMKTSTLFLALVLLLVTTSIAEVIHAKGVCNGTVAECNGEEEWLMESDTMRQLLQGGNKATYRSLQRQSACATSRGGAYENNCFSRVNGRSRGCDPIYGCRNN